MPAMKIPAADGVQNVAAVQSSDRQAKAADSLQVTFSRYMNQNTVNNAAASGLQQAKPDTAAKPADGSVKESYSQYQGKGDAKAGGIKTQEGKPAQADAKAAGDALQEAETQIKELLEQELGVDAGQIEAAMELFGLTALDLLNPNQLAALTVELTGSADIGAVLFNQNFQDILQGVSVITDGLLQELGITMEELTDIAKAQLEVQPQEEMPDAADVPVDTDIRQAQQADTPQANVEAPKQEAGQAVAAAQDMAGKAAVQTETGTEAVQDPAMDSGEGQRPLEAVQKTVQEDAGEGAKQQLSGQEEDAQPQDTEQSQGQDFELENGFGNKNQPQLGAQAGQEEGHAEFTPHVHRQDGQAPVQGPVNQAPLPQANVQDVIQQIVEYTKVSLTQQVKTIEMQLNPENLGKVFLHISEKQGIVTAQITAQNENIKEALIQQAAELKDNLNQQGIKVEAVEVSAGAHEFEKNLEKDTRQQEEQERRQKGQGSGKSRRSINLNDLNGLSGLSGLMSEEEALVAQIMRDNGNNVDFRA